MPLITITGDMGTNIGEFTFGGGLAAAFDGTTSKAASACARAGDGGTSWMGKTLPTALRFVQATVYGANDQGFHTGTNDSMGIRVYGKNGAAFVAGTDVILQGGTLLGEVTFTDTANESGGRLIESTDTATFWDHLAIRIGGGGSDMNVAQIAFVCATRPTSSAVIFG